MMAATKPDAGDTQRRDALWSRLKEAKSESSATLERVAKNTPSQVQAITDEARVLEQEIRARIERDAARTTPIPPPPPLTAPLVRGVLVLEDDDLLREDLVKTLSRFCDAPVWGAEDAEEAQRVFDRERPEMVIADVHLRRGPNGDHVLRRMPPGVHRVVVSGTVRDETLATAARLAKAIAVHKDAEMVPALIVLVTSLLSPKR